MPSPNSPDGLKSIFKAFANYYEEIERRSRTLASVGLWFSSKLWNRAYNKQDELHALHYDLGTYDIKGNTTLGVHVGYVVCVEVWCNIT